MPVEPLSRLTVGLLATGIVTGLAALMAVLIRDEADTVPSRQEAVRVVVAAAPAPTLSAATSQSPLLVSNNPAKDPENLTAALIKQFPAIREARIICEGECKLVAALGDQGLTPTPFNGNLERFLTEQGYNLRGDLVIDQPGDNDTLLTIPLDPPRDVMTWTAPAPAQLRNTAAVVGPRLEVGR